MSAFPAFLRPQEGERDHGGDHRDGLGLLVGFLDLLVRLVVLLHFDFPFDYLFQMANASLTFAQSASISVRSTLPSVIMSRMMQSGLRKPL